MLAIGFRFLAGRYHANPWGRHVNEADVEWPPAPWRLCRALISTWHHKLDPQDTPFEKLEALIDALSETSPVYKLPPAVHTHTRHWMPQWKGSPSLVFDAFARVNPEDELVMAWPELELDAQLVSLLDELLHRLGYLGRAESWVEARRLDNNEIPADFPCRPGEQDVDPRTGEVLGEVVRLLRPRRAADYAAWRENFVRDELAVQRGRRREMLRFTTPEGLVAALSLDTADLQKSGWSRPPAGEYVHYLRDPDSLQPVVLRSQTNRPARVATTARFLLSARPLPRIEDAVRVGEAFRAALMGRAKQVLGDKNALPPELSGHGLGEGNRHGHAFYLPEDADGDGCIDHLLVHAPGGLTPEAQRVLAHLSVVRSRGGIEWRVLLEDVGQTNNFSASSRYVASSQIWQSVTPYLRPWHLKKRATEQEQIAAFIRKECRLRGLPEPVKVEWLMEIPVHGKLRRTIHFHRFRNKRGLMQPDTRGCFLRLHFESPVRGPLALGFGCHFGLGMFQPVDRSSQDNEALPAVE